MGGLDGDEPWAAVGELPGEEEASDKVDEDSFLESQAATIRREAARRRRYVGGPGMGNKKYNLD